MSNVYIHPSALVETDRIGDGTRIWAYAHLLADCEIGAECNIGDHCFIEGGVRVGKGVTIKNGNMLWEGVTIEDEVFIGPGVVFTNDAYPRSPRSPRAKERYAEKARWLRRTVIEQGASLGAGSVILPGLRIGRFSLVAAGSVLTRDVPAFGLVKGNPARLSGWVCKCGLPLKVTHAQACCAECGENYQLMENKTLKTI
jgi:acetyltransferase-like isoleucine patch superfamily enzyme